MDIADTLLFKQVTQSRLTLLIRVLSLDPHRLRLEGLVKTLTRDDDPTVNMRTRWDRGIGVRARRKQRGLARLLLQRSE